VNFALTGTKGWNLVKKSKLLIFVLSEEGNLLSSGFFYNFLPMQIRDESRSSFCIC
jgi:hypothetical protein